MTTPDRPDIFGSESLPSVSFKDVPHGTTVRFLVTSHPELVQSRNFETRQPEHWPDGNPKYSAVLNGKVNGEDRSLWAQKPSALFGAIGGAQKVAGRPVQPGDTLVVSYTHDEPNKTNPRLNPAKQFTVVLEPGSPFGESNTAPQAAPPVAPQQTAPAPATSVASDVKLLNPEQYAALAQAGVDMSAFAIAGVSA